MDDNFVKWLELATVAEKSILCLFKKFIRSYRENVINAQQWEY